MNTSVKLRLSAGLVAGSLGLLAQPAAAGVAADVEDLGVPVSGTQPREYSFSDKEAGFYYGMTGCNDWDDFYAGWNIRAKRIFSDYRLSVDGKPLDRSAVSTVVYPYGLKRSYGNATERFLLFDGKKVILIALSDVEGDRIGISLTGENLKNARFSGNSVIYDSAEVPGDVVRVSAVDGKALAAFAGGAFSAPAASGGFVLAYGTEQETAKLIADFRKEGDEWTADRKQRMQNLVDRNRLRSDSDTLDRALAWIELTADELITRQHGGWGMYAGFPWFTDFWGRDMFIAMPGVVLCTGQFEVAKDILASFAKYQDMNPESPTYGRVPNRLNLDGILYNTTDGTPRFVMQVYDYLKYTGDVDFVKQIYKHVKVATDASLKLYTDGRGYLKHEDADTWMDAKRQSKYPCSPRGDRAVDIQALWYDQLVYAAELADYMDAEEDAARWRAVAGKLRLNFEHDFVDRENGRIYDHLNADGSGDTQLRPNTIYAHELISDKELAMTDTRNVWEKLVYPWGVSSLNQYDGQFHPYHEQWHRYHKDDAYHNGTVWLWLNGQAMQRMIEYGQADAAFRLFENMNRQALAEGAVGSLSECADAWPRAGKVWARRSGTFLQAWSNGEHIRVWDQYFLGIRPDMLRGEIKVNPELPSKLADISTAVAIADGELAFEYRKTAGETVYRYQWTGSNPVVLVFDVEDFGDFRMEVGTGGTVDITVKGDSLSAKLTEHGAGIRMKVEADSKDADKTAFRKKCDEFFEGTDFAEPCYREDLKSMSRYFDPPLDYYSVE